MFVLRILLKAFALLIFPFRFECTIFLQLVVRRARERKKKGMASNRFGEIKLAHYGSDNLFYILTRELWHRIASNLAFRTQSFGELHVEVTLSPLFMFIALRLVWCDLVWSGLV